MSNNSLLALGSAFARFVCRSRPNKYAETGIKYLREFLRKVDNLNWNFETNGEKRVIEIIARIDPSLVFDVGANEGDWSTMARVSFPNAEIHAFEIVETTFSRLHEKLSEDDLVRANCFGLSDQNGTVKINFSHRDTTVATANKIPGMKQHEDLYEDQIDCKTMRGDTYMDLKGLEGIDFLKIDTEGSDLRVLKGFGEKLGTIRIIQFEYGIFNIASRDLLLDFFILLNSAGFIIGKVYPSYVDFFDYHFSKEDFGGNNYIAIQKTETKLISLLSSTQS